MTTSSVRAQVAQTRHVPTAWLHEKHGRLATNAACRQRSASYPVAPPSSSRAASHCAWLASSSRARGAKGGGAGGVGGGSCGGGGGGAAGGGSCGGVGGGEDGDEGGIDGGGGLGGE